MHSSFSVSLEPGLDRGVPWGRDLYTFVTSAAGHMMRTLQKPRKNRPSKRQVNHRRFLHNMIQRKFADIEAANHRLASALYFKVDEKKPDTPDTPSPPQTNSLPASEKSTAVEDIVLNSKDCVTIDSQDTEMRGKEQPELRQLWKQHPKSRKNKQTQKKTVCDQNLLKCTSINSTCIDRDTEHFCGDENPTDTLFPVDPPADLTESSFLQFGRNVDTSSCFSPELSPLSLDSCDLSAQMFTDISSCTPAQKSIGEIAESQWADIIDLFSVGSKDFRGCANVDAYFESICEYQSDAEGKVGTEDELEDLFCERGQCKYEYSCHSNQVGTTNPFPIELSSSEFTSHNESPTETQLNNFLSNSTNILQTELPSSMNYNSMSYQHPPQESLCMLGQYEHNLIPFEGVAQSFSAPSHDDQRCSILTPPHEGEWLFTDILTDRTLSLS